MHTAPQKSEHILTGQDYRGLNAPETIFLFFNFLMHPSDDKIKKITTNFTQSNDKYQKLDSPKLKPTNDLKTHA